VILKLAGEGSGHKHSNRQMWGGLQAYLRYGSRTPIDASIAAASRTPLRVFNSSSKRWRSWLSAMHSYSRSLSPAAA
jgi:hypothetical protein